MRRNRPESTDTPTRYGDPGNMWHALARLHAAHPEPVGRSVPFERAAALLSIVKPVDILLAARVGLSGKETMRHLHDLVDTVTRNIFTESPYGESTLASDVALEVVVSKRHELALHTAHVAGFTRLLRDAVGTIGAGSAPGEGECCHCDGTGQARPLWKPSLSAGHDVA